MSSATSLGGRNVDATSGLGVHCICCMHGQLACKCKVPRSNTDRLSVDKGVCPKAVLTQSADQNFLTTRKKATGREAANIIHVARGCGQSPATSCMLVRTLQPVIHAAFEVVFCTHTWNLSTRPSGLITAEFVYPISCTNWLIQRSHIYKNNVLLMSLQDSPCLRSS